MRRILQRLRTALVNLLRVHTPTYLESLQDPATLTGIFGAPVPPDEVADILDLQRLSVGGTIQATRLALGGRRARGAFRVRLAAMSPG